MNATRRLILEAILATAPCPDGPINSCAYCIASAVEEALETGAAMDRHPAKGQLSIPQTLCDHRFSAELLECRLCGVEYREWVKA